MTPRNSAPTESLQHGDDHAFRVWASNPTYQEDTLPWKCLAVFYYLQECLDYIDYCQKRGADVIFQSPTGCRTFPATKGGAT